MIDAITVKKIVIELLDIAGENNGISTIFDDEKKRGHRGGHTLYIYRSEWDSLIHVFYDNLIVMRCNVSGIKEISSGEWIQYMIMRLNYLKRST